MWCSGSTRQQPSLHIDLNSDDSFATIDVKFLCVSITPLGVPVVPDVKISDASVSGLSLRCSALSALLLDVELRQLERLLKRPHLGGRDRPRRARA